MKDVVYRAVSASVNGAVDDEVRWIVNVSVDGAVDDEVRWAKDWVVHTDSGHPTLQEFLHSCIPAGQWMETT